MAFEIKSCVGWAGGKVRLLSQILPAFPKTFNRYFEPFVGGGSVLYEIEPSHGYISDINSELINMYQVLKSKPRELIADLKKHLDTETYYYEVRNIDRSPDQYKLWTDVEKASRFIYLNKRCFNKLYRVNSRNQFNVGYGGEHQIHNPVFKEETILNCSRVLQNVDIRNESYTWVEDMAVAGYFVYLDPPYIPKQKNGFVQYTGTGFNEEDHIRLRDMCDGMTKKGVKFVLSNSDTETANELYKNYTIIKVYATRSINSDTSGRGKISEILVTNHNEVHHQHGW